MLAWELLTGGDIPYFAITSDDAVVAYVVGGGMLARPESECPDALWEVVVSCWQEPPRERPTFSKLAVRLGQLAPPSGDAGMAPALGAGTAPAVAVQAIVAWNMRTTSALRAAAEQVALGSARRLPISPWKCV